MTVDSAYQIEYFEAHEGLVYTFDTESIGSPAIEVYIIDSLNNKALLPGSSYTLEFGYRDPIHHRGTVTLLTPLAKGTFLSIERRTPRTQDLVIENNKQFPSGEMEFGMDKITFMLQELEGHLCDCRGDEDGPGDACIPVTITVQPQNETADVGETATFTVETAGSTPISYQWYRDGLPIEGETSNVYSFTIAAEDHNSTYRVTVINYCGQEVSDTAILTVTSATDCPLVALDQTNLIIHGYFTEGIGNVLSTPTTGTDNAAWTIIDPNSWVPGPLACEFGIRMSQDIRSCSRVGFPPGLTGLYTLCWWMKCRSGFLLSTSAAPIDGSNPLGNKYSGHQFHDEGGVIKYNGGNGGSQSASNRRTFDLPGIPITNDDVWHHVAITWNGISPVDCYFDGVLGDAPVYLNGTAVTIEYRNGASIRNTGWNVDETTPTINADPWGDFADFRVYSEQLSAPRILAIAQGTA